MKTVSDMILDHMGKDDRNIIYKYIEEFTTRDKKVDISKAIRDINYKPTIKFQIGIPATIERMKKVYNIPTIIFRE